MLIARIRDTPLSESKAFSVCLILTIRRVKMPSYLMIRYRFSPEQTHDFIRSPSPMANSIRPAFQLYGRFCKSIKVNIIRHNSRITSAVVENILEWVRWREPCFCLRRNTLFRQGTESMSEQFPYQNHRAIVLTLSQCQHSDSKPDDVQSPISSNVSSFFAQAQGCARKQTNLYHVSEKIRS